MLYRGPKRDSTGRRRRGSVTLWVVGMLIALTGLFVFVLDHPRLGAARVEMQNSGDAAALAAARSLVNEFLLTGDQSYVPPLATAAAREGRTFAFVNTVFGAPVTLDPNPNPPTGDIIIGYLNFPTDKTIQLVDVSGQTTLADPLMLNTVQTNAHSTAIYGNYVVYRVAWSFGYATPPVFTQTTATLDRDVYGFQSDSGISAPLVPIGISSTDWQSQVEQMNGPDAYQFNVEQQQFVSGSDGLHEITLTVYPAGGNSYILQIGPSTTWAGMTGQVTNGVGPDVFNQFSPPQWALDSNGQLPTPILTPSGQSDLDQLAAQLQALQATARPRVWPLVTGTDGSGNAVVTGFVTARVANVLVAQSGGTTTSIQVTVQPSMLSTSCALTDASRRPSGAPVGNRYVCKIRLVE